MSDQRAEQNTPTTAEVLFGQYLEALRAAGEDELATLMGNLNPRTWPMHYGEPEDRSPRHVVEVHGATLQVVITADGILVEVTEVPEGIGRVRLGLGLEEVEIHVGNL